jgi:hypothetical protein
VRRLVPILVLLFALVGAAEARAYAYVNTTAEFDRAVDRIGNGAGTIVLERGRYGTLTIGWRSPGARWLTVRAARGAITKSVIVERARRVRLVGLRVTNYWGAEALVSVTDSSRVRMEKLTVVGKNGRRARVRVWRSSRVSLRRSDLSRCGNEKGATCLSTPLSRYVTVADNVFHDCRGCDFLAIAGVRRMRVVRNTFDRALPGPCRREATAREVATVLSLPGPARPNDCNHQDLVQVSGAHNLLIERNRFGVYKNGAAQLYVSAVYRVDRLTIRDNLFLRTDPSVPGVAALNGIILGNPPVPWWVRKPPTRVVVAGNTILSGAPRVPAIYNRWRNVANGLIISQITGRIAPELRPFVVNNLIGSTSHPELVCTHVRASRYNHYANAAPCSGLDGTGDPLIEPDGYPTADSPLRDRAGPRWASRRDFSGWARDEKPDIGAWEWREER